LQQFYLPFQLSNQYLSYCVDLSTRSSSYTISRYHCRHCGTYFFVENCGDTNFAADYNCLGCRRLIVKQSGLLLALNNNYSEQDVVRIDGQKGGGRTPLTP
jgi:hypothetical protein